MSARSRKTGSTKAESGDGGTSPAKTWLVDLGNTRLKWARAMKRLDPGSGACTRACGLRGRRNLRPRLLAATPAQRGRSRMDRIGRIAHVDPSRRRRTASPRRTGHGAYSRKAHAPACGSLTNSRSIAARRRSVPCPACCASASAWSLADRQRRRPRSRSTCLAPTACTRAD